MSFKGSIDWPYDIKYGTITHVDTDILIIGGGIAGPWAAIEAAKRGVKVALAEEADALSAGPSGCDHWGPAFDHPASHFSPEEFVEIADSGSRGYHNGILSYVNSRESYKTLLELEKMGAKVRDDADEFKGAPFRDEATKLLFAYDYETNHTIRVWGQTFKLALYGEMLRQDVELYNRIYITSLLTEDGTQGNRVIGATGVNVRTGEFYVFRSKAAILCTGRASDRPWLYNGYRITGLRSPNLVGSGLAMAWRAGAELTQFEGKRVHAASKHPAYATGNPRNTWYPCSIVDAEGKEVPYISADGKLLSTFEERVYPSKLGKKIIMPGHAPSVRTGKSFESDGPVCLSEKPEFDELVRKGEYKLPLYADLTKLSEYERRVIFGLMIAEEGKTWVVYRNLTQAGFDPDKDLLQYYGDWFGGVTLDASARRGWTMSTSSGVVTDWDFKTTLNGLYGAGDAIFGSNTHSAAATAGRWAGAKAAQYVKDAKNVETNETQIQNEVNRVYAPTKRTIGPDWKDLNTGISSILRTYFGEYVNDQLLNIGLTWLNELEEKEAKELVASNPHELMRSLETLDLLTVAQIIFNAALNRKASSKVLNLRRLDYREDDPKEWTKFLTLKQKDGKVVVGERPHRFWLQPPNAPTYQENYEKHKPW